MQWKEEHGTGWVEVGEEMNGLGEKRGIGHR